MAQHSRHFEVGGVKILFSRSEHAAEKQVYDPRAGYAAQQRNTQPNRKPKRREASEQVTDASEPGQKRSQRNRVEHRVRSPAAGVPSVANVQVSSGMGVAAQAVRQMPVQGSQQERQHAEGKTQRE